VQHTPTIRKVPADSVRYGREISRRGHYVYAAYDGETFVCAAATVSEARRKYRAIQLKWASDETWRRIGQEPPAGQD
jgi:hypothetical protein